MENLLIFSIKRFTIAFINAIMFVVPLEFMGVVFGVFDSFDGGVVFITSAVLAFVQLLIILYSIDIEIQEEDE